MCIYLSVFGYRKKITKKVGKGLLDKRKNLVDELNIDPVVEDDRNSAVSFSSFVLQRDQRAYHFSSNA
jgi:hypothetical protein